MSANDMMNPAPKSKKIPPFSLHAPAKVNLGLRITGKRPDGYHDLQSLMVPLSFGDELNFEVLDQEGAWSAICDKAEIPMGEGSLIEKAFRLAARSLSYSGGLKVVLKKVIPTGAGLGGGSSDAAVVMKAVEKITGRQLSAALYPEIAYTVGADVPFFLRDGAKWILGIGEKLSAPVRLPRFHLILIHPGVGIATKWVYSQLNIQSLTSKDSAVSLPPAFESFACMSRYLGNDLESVVLPHYPVVGEMKDALLALEADTALMSGSGSTVFGLYSDPNKRDKTLKILKAEHPHWWIVPASNLS